MSFTIPSTRFGYASYRHILTLKPAVELTGEQNRVLETIEAITSATDIRDLEDYLQVLTTKEYGQILRTQHLKPPGRVKAMKKRLTTRKRYHTPFTDLFLNLTHRPNAQKVLVDTLIETLRSPAQQANPNKARHLRDNALAALVDIYFYALRPGGEAFTSDRLMLGHHARVLNTTVDTELRPPASDLLSDWGQTLRAEGTPPPREQFNQASAFYLQRYLVDQLQGLLTDKAVPLKTRRLLMDELRLGECDIVRKDWPIVSPPVSAENKYYMQGQLGALFQVSLPRYTEETTPQVAEPITTELKSAIRNGNISRIVQIMDYEALKKLVPDWQRAKWGDNHQHWAQTYTLVDHLTKVLQSVQASEDYPGLTQDEQFRVSTAAIFHDIAKRTGPKNFRDAGRIIPDVHHPWRCAEALLEILPALRYTPDEVEDIYTIVKRHQNLGQLAKPKDPYSPGGGEATIEQLQNVASRLKTVSRLRMLKVLTEADVRCVKEDVPGTSWFTPEFSERLDRYTHQITQLMASPYG